MEKMILEFYNCKRELKGVIAELLILPDGFLVKKRAFYYHWINGKEYGITKNPDIIAKLCRKRDLLIRKRQLEKTISFLSHPMSKLEAFKREEATRKLPRAYQGLPNFYFYHSSIAAWLAESYKRNTYPLKKDEGITSKKGITFRSKSEYIIGDKLDDYDLPYRYEGIIQLDKFNTISPDFIIKHPFYEHLIIWEHFGALHLPEYVKKMNHKIDLYMRHGYIPFKNLICTYEPDIKDPRRLQNLIENIILK